MITVKKWVEKIEGGLLNEEEDDPGKMEPLNSQEMRE